jgi:hypothetical protein
MGVPMSNKDITYLVGACCGVFGLAAFCALVVAPAVAAYRRPLERVAAVVLSLYVLAALAGVGVVVGAVIIVEWPRFF